MIAKTKTERTVIEDDDSLEAELDYLEEEDGCEKDEHGHLILHITNRLRSKCGSPNAVEG